MKTIGNSFDFRENSFGYLRFVFAMLVMFGHTYGLGGFGREPIELATRFQESSGTLAVYGFFTVSGFLVTRSFISSANIISYALKRALRILPGFWVCLMVTSFVFAPLVYFSTYGNMQGFLTYKPAGPFNYITTNLFLLMHEYSIAGLLSNNPYPFAFNGSLWTLFPEAKAYAALGLLGVFGFFGKKRYIMVVVFICLWLLLLLNISVTESPNKYVRLVVDPSFLLYGTYFAAGSCLFLFRSIIPLNKWFFVSAIILSLLAGSLGFLHVSLPILFPIIILWLAQNLPFQNFTKHGDFSYGIYIYAFPIQQLLTFFNLNQEIISYFLLTFIITMLAAVCSWRFVEKPALSIKKYVLRPSHARLRTT